MIKKHIELIEMNQKSNREKNPNVVFIFADDLGYGDLSCYGATKIQTPHIDKIAEEGVSFTDAHSSSAVCTPSRYSVITGRYCWRTWLKKWVIFGHGLPLIEKDRKTIGDLFQENGYKTAAIGKWHLGLGWNFKEGFEKKKTQNHYDAVNYTKNLTHCPNDLGFDYFFGIAGSLDMYPYCFFENDHVYGDPPTKLKDTLYQQQRKGYQANNWKDEEVDITFTEKALQFIDKCHEEDPDKPFFLYLPTSSPHRPCDIQPEFVKGESEAGDRGDMVILFDWIVGQVEQKLQDL